MKNVFSFSLKLLIVLVIAFPVHAFVQNVSGLDFFDNLIIESYLSNFVLVVISYAVLFKLQVKYTNSLGFIFMGGSFVKFTVFFIFFNPHYKLDNEVEVSEFLGFFVPYSIALSIETISLVRFLNKA
jgi:hypothetical protein